MAQTAKSIAGGLADMLNASAGRQRAESLDTPQSPGRQPLLQAGASTNAPARGDTDAYCENHYGSGLVARQPERRGTLDYQTITGSSDARSGAAVRRKTPDVGYGHDGRRDARADSRATRRRNETEGRLKSALRYFRSVELENKGSVARDHLALERTFLAWLRTSLAFASIGIAVTQLFRLNTSITGDTAADHALRRVGRPLGVTFLGISILVLFLGYNRFLQAQYWVMRGKFPASRGTVMLVSLVAFAAMVASLVVVIAVHPSSEGVAQKG